MPTPTDKTEELMRLADDYANAHLWAGNNRTYVRSTLRAAIEKALSDAMANAHAEGMGDALEELRDELAELERYRDATPDGLALSDAESWLRNRAEIVEAVAAEGLTIVLTASGTRLMRLGKMVAQAAAPAQPAAEPAPLANGLTEAETAQTASVMGLMRPTEREIMKSALRQVRVMNDGNQHEWFCFAPKQWAVIKAHFIGDGPAAEPAGITLTVEAVSQHFGNALARAHTGKPYTLNTGTAVIDFASLKPGMRLVAVVNERNFVVSAIVEGE